MIVVIDDGEADMALVREYGGVEILNSIHTTSAGRDTTQIERARR